MENITYIFASDRKKYIENNNIQASEFFYGLNYFDKENYKLNIIEFDEKISLINKLVQLVDIFFRKFVSLPFYTSKLLSLNNLKTLYRTDHLIMINESVGCSALLLIILIKRIKKIKCHLFVMGLYSKNLRFPKVRTIHFYVIKILVRNLDNLFFLGKEELKIAKKTHPQYKKKFHYFPFSIDTKFWSNDEFVPSKNEQIIFVGNDGNRDFKLLIEIAEHIPDKEFLFISQSQYLKDLKLDNVKILEGKWGSLKISDETLKDYYLNSRICILPLKDSTQPSGQSVSLQCMSLGIPIMISKTKGFWDYDSFQHEENILFTNNSLNSWVENINSFYEKTTLLDSISANAKNMVVNNYNLKTFYDNLKNKIFT